MNLNIKIVLYIIFIVSGFTGLIYESIWTHYLKLILGHASYAQTLVLALFMGGMAFGAWIASRFSIRWKNPLLLYAFVEAIIGLMALSFHQVFIVLTDYLHISIFPNLTPELIQIVKWLTASLLILPQSILLGLTFPLMSSGIIRLSSNQSGSTIAMLYFSNSIGAALGVVFSSFILIATFGLPGTVKIAGLLNILIAIIVLILENINTFEKNSTTINSSLEKTPFFLGIGLMLAALITGIASFFYEIAWIRMLSMVLGSSVHSFELMLSAFIVGLAFGGLWIRSYINHIKKPILWFAIIQIIMGIFALLTIPLYNLTFDGMAYLIQALNLSQNGYTLYNIGSHLIATSIMLPTTFMAGMTLPLLTQTLFIRGAGEKSIGQIYTANTLGAIVGILLAVHIIIPLTDLRTLIISGVTLDLIVGISILFFITRHKRQIKIFFIVFIILSCFISIFQYSHFDPYRMASSVYRIGKAKLANVTIIHKDGKTASIDIIEYKQNDMAIATNGKIDARINSVLSEPSVDEITMVLMGVLPLIYYPDAQNIANIGLGSGMTSHTILGSSSIVSLNTIEIEEKIVDLAKNFGSRTERVYTDPRSHIYIEDAKTFFSQYQQKYDVIISEPSNPWVSGVASLFTKEFYKHIKKYLSTNGLFVQWIQLYENNEQIMASVFKSLDSQFTYYKVFNSGDSDIIIIASMQDTHLKEMKSTIYSNPNILQSLTRVNLPTFSDLQLHYIGDKNIFSAIFSTYNSPLNSDYYPYLAYNAPKARFMDLNAVNITRLHLLPVPILRMLNQQNNNEFTVKNINFTANNRQLLAKNIAHKITQSSYIDESVINEKNLNMINSILYQCKQNKTSPLLQKKNLLTLAGLTTPFLIPKEAADIWSNLLSNCHTSSDTKKWLKLYLAIANRATAQIPNIVNSIISSEKELSKDELDYLISSGMTSLILQNQKDEAVKLWKQFEKSYDSSMSKLHHKLLINLALQ